MSLLTTATLAVPSHSRDLGAADVGASFIALTPTPGTGVIGHAVNTTFVETKPNVCLFNGGSLNIYPLYLRLTLTVASVANAQQQFTTTLDQGNRYSSGGTALTIANTNINSGQLSAAQINVGAVTATAASPQRRILHHRVFRVVIGVAGDVYQWNFGASVLTNPSTLATAGTAIANVLYGGSPIVVSPGCSLLITAWGATYSTGNTFEYEFGYAEK